MATTSASASLVFTWRLFDGGGDEARVRQARAAERQWYCARKRSRSRSASKSSKRSID